MTRLVSLSVGLPRVVPWKGRVVSTGIFKSPVSGPVMLRRHNLDGDGQADLSVHGGPTKAVYAYPVQHYDFWREELPELEFTWGSFGENFTAEGVDEESVCIGDEFRIGGAHLVVTEPRMPCYKLGVRFDRADMVKRFLKSERSGFYFGVVEEGMVEEGDRLEQVAAQPDGLRVADVTRLYTTEKSNAALLQKAVATSVLPQSWRGYFAHQLERLQT